MKGPDLPAHGGDLHWAQAHFGGEPNQWLDLSTGISPWPWPVPPVPQSVWQRLPPVNDASLRLAAADFYGCGLESVLPVPGSQFAINCLPHTQPAGRVAVPDPGYQEHAKAWAAAGHTLVYYGGQQQLADLIEKGAVQSAVVINPNNPSGEQVERSQLLDWRQQLARRAGLLVVDEAFADIVPENSLAPLLPLSNLVVLRSVGKFFGLAGVRLGFALADADWLARLQPWCSPWQVSHPAEWLGHQALLDANWQSQQRQRLAQQARRLTNLLQTIFPGASVANGGLFATVSHCEQSLYDVFVACGRQHLLLRYGKTRQGREWLRFGLPGSDVEDLRMRLMNSDGLEFRK